MKIEKLEFNKIKVTVYPVDLIDMNIKPENLRPDSPQLHGFLSSIMEKIKQETGFNPYSKRTVVEASPLGDCIVLTVTTLGEKSVPIKTTAKKSIKAVLKNKKDKNNVFIFDNFDNMCGAIIRFGDSSLSSGTLYKIEKSYALSFPHIKDSEKLVMREFALMNDKSPLACDFLNEHAEIIASGDKLLSLANGIRELSLN